MRTGTAKLPKGQGRHCVLSHGERPFSVLAAAAIICVMTACSGDAAPADFGVDGPQSDGRLADTKDSAVAAVPGTWVTLPAGVFMMGSLSTEPCRNKDEDHHQVTLTRSYEIQSREANQNEFSTLMGYNPSRFGSQHPPTSPLYCSADCPVEMLTWHEAAAYCNALSKLAGKASCYTCAGNKAGTACQAAAAYVGQKYYGCPGYRLPTEAEWEYAYRAGTTTAFYNGSNDPAMCGKCTDSNADAIGWFSCNAAGRTHPVKQKQANAWGLHDMAGNAGEWCHDGYQANLGTTAVTDPVLPGTSHHVVRGGSVMGSAVLLRAAGRVMYYHTAPAGGVRCVRTK